MDTYRVTLTGKAPLIMHRDNIEWADQMEKWRNAPENKGGSVRGDDRSPAHTWIGCVYHDGEKLIIPAENVMRSMMEAGAMVPTGQGKKTFKSQSQSGISPLDNFKFLLDGEEVPFSPIEDLKNERDFDTHQEIVKDLGFTLFTLRAKVGTSKHVRVRPRFAKWSCVGELYVIDEMITHTVLQTILSYAGKYKGLCDWRPGCATPGVFGTFNAEVKRI